MKVIIEKFKSISLERFFCFIRKVGWFNKWLKTIHKLLHDLVTATLIFKTLASYHLMEFGVYCAGWFIQQTLILFIDFDLINLHIISEALSDARKHDFRHALSHVQSHLELSKLDVRAHRQADVTDQQLHDQVYCDHDDTDQILMAVEKWNVWYNCIKNIDQTL